MISFLGSFALKFAFFAHFMHFRSKNRYDLRAVSWGKFIWKKLICVKNSTFRNSGYQVRMMVMIDGSHFTVQKKGPKMFNFELLFLHGFSSKNGETLHKAILKNIFLGKNVEKMGGK